MARIESERYTPRYGLVNRVETASTGTNLVNYGLSLLPSTGQYTLDPPKVGVTKVISVSGASTELYNVYTGSTNISFASTGVARQATFDDTGETLLLIGANSTSWVIASNQTSVVLSTGP